MQFNRNLAACHRHASFHTPGLLHGYIAIEFFQPVLSSVVVDNQDALFHVRPLGSLEDGDRSARTLDVIMITNAPLSAQRNAFSLISQFNHNMFSPTEELTLRYVFNRFSKYIICCKEKEN